jgi:hypothetical protein
MRRPQPTLMNTPRQQAAAIFAFEHFRVMNHFDFDSIDRGLQYISVQRCFRAWRHEVQLDRLPLEVERDNRARGRCACGNKLPPFQLNRVMTMCSECLDQLLGHRAA